MKEKDGRGEKNEKGLWLWGVRQGRDVTGGADGREAGGIGQEVEWKQEEEVIRDERGDIV